MTNRENFIAQLGFSLDKFQVKALDAIDQGKSVLVAAPTGSGKTVIGEYAVARALSRGGKCFYTTPLKALSNQKFSDLREKYGDKSVGLLTGDNSVNASASILVMTTEVLRNMIYADSSALEGLESVVLDEVHYLQDRHRGPVWEEVIVHLPLEVDLVCLSATVSNAEQFSDWIETVRGATTVIIEEKRPVDLRHRYLVAERDVDELIMLPVFVDDALPSPPNPDAVRLDRRTSRGPRGVPRPARRLVPPRRAEMLERLDQEEMLPAIVFTFSRAGCDEAVRQCVAARLSYTNAEERQKIAELIDKHTAQISDDDLAVLEFGSWRAGLEAGISSHHAGLIPPFKEAVEEGFTQGLLKVVFATETLSLGINMPARTVVIEKLTKFTGEHHDFLTPGEYTQLTGRAGRRGIDSVGYAVVLWSPWTTFEQVAGLASRRTDALRSSFRPTYNMTVNLVDKYSPERSQQLLNLSFAQFYADRDVVAMETRLERRFKSLEEATKRAVSGYGDLESYRELLNTQKQERSAARKLGNDPKQRAVVEGLKPGDVLWLAGRGGKVLVLSQQTKRSSIQVLILLSTGRTARINPNEFPRISSPVGHIDLPTPYLPRDRSFQKVALRSLNRFTVQRDKRSSKKKRKNETLEKASKKTLGELIRAHPVSTDPDIVEILKAADERDLILSEIDKQRNRATKQSDSLAQKFERVQTLLEQWGYIAKWELTERGEILSRLYTEVDLLLAQSLAQGDLDGLTAPEIAAVVSCFTYESRGRDDDETNTYEQWPTKELGMRISAIEKTAKKIAKSETATGVPVSRGPDSGFVDIIYRWVNGNDLYEVLANSELAGGDFVRGTKQCIDVLRQCALVAPNPETQAVAAQAADIAQRGVVAAMGSVA
ncbi:unannotated protein [freshwater metagenome]|uniref:Unannotated protein n=1 Tax=freshwater metagenome TaxID=449393 RepID=A0A6J7GRX8_9ZZZZ|nr:DEAD/DEAH box helicase [Actinomycetota bacterium]MSW61406.1 DEAD/DEAH box helicase [Actinomycetota bacterium]